MGDSWRPQYQHPRPRRDYYDSDNPDNARRSRGGYHYDDARRGDRSRERSNTRLEYEVVDEDSNDPYYRDKEEPRYLDGRVVRQVPEGGLIETGEKDISYDGAENNFVLIRNLKPSVSKERLAKDLEKFYKDFDDVWSGARAKSLRRVFIIRERRSDQSVGYGFAEYHSLRDAVAVVQKSHALKKAGKCTISSAEVTMDHPHNGVFPNADFGVAERKEEFTFKMANTGRLHKYRDERYYASEFMVNPDAPDLATSKNTIDNANADKKTSTKAGTKRGIDTLDSKAKKVKSSTTGPAFLQHWQSKQKELRGEPEVPPVESSTDPASGVNTIQATHDSFEATSNEQTFAYAPEDGKAGCYLCGSEFGTKEALLRHLNESGLHATNLKDDKLVSRGYQRLEKKGIDPETTIKLPKPAGAQQTTTTTTESQDSYRDRAKERRLEENKTIGFSIKGATRKHKKAGGKVSGSSSDNEASKPSYGKGKNMLQKAGWSEGEGLGAGGGITAPIDQSLYTSGVGLGHESSKKGDAVDEASRMTKNDRGDFLEQTKILAKKRYEQME